MIGGFLAVGIPWDLLRDLEPRDAAQVRDALVSEREAMRG